jgi:hypothetical protein
MWACINRGSPVSLTATRGGNWRFSGCDSGYGCWSRRCLPQSLRFSCFSRPSTGVGVRGPYVSVPALTHSCRTFYSHPPPPTVASTPLHLQFKPRQHQLLLHNLQPETPTTTTIPPLRPATIITPARNFLRTATNKRFPFFVLRRHYSSANMAESELKWPAAKVRQTFFDYFAKRGHTIGMREMR